MASFVDNGPLFTWEQDMGIFSPQDSHCQSPKSPQHSASASTRQEIVEEAQMDGGIDDGEEAAFIAEAEAFVRKRDVHQLAVRRLLQDLVEDDELEAAKKTRDGKQADVKCSLSIVEASSIGALELEKNFAADAPHGNPEAASETIVGEEKDETGLLLNTSGSVNDISRQENYPQNGGQNGRSGLSRTWQHANKNCDLISNGKNTQQLEHSSSKKRTQPSKERAQNKTSSWSPIKTRAALSSKKLNRVSQNGASFPNKTSAKGSSTSKSSIQEESKREWESESDRVQTKVKEFLHKRKPPVGFDSKRALGAGNNVLSGEHNSSSVGPENADTGPFLLKLAKRAIASGGKPQKALDYATRAVEAYEVAADGKPSLDLVMSLNVLSALHCSLGQNEEAVAVLERSLAVLEVEAGGQEHALAAFAGYMQLGDTMALLGKGEEALSAYSSGLEIQMGALGKKDPRVSETCRYLAEAFAQALQFDKAEGLCQHALDIDRQHSAPASMEEATDRRLLGLIYNGKGQHEAALENLVLASMALASHRNDLEVAAVDASIGDTYVCLGRLDEAVVSYQKSLTIFKASKGESHVDVASLYISLAGLCLKTGKPREARAYCESALRIYSKQTDGHLLEEVATGLTEIAIMYEAWNEWEKALSFLDKALAILEAAPGQQSAVAGVEAQIGVFHYLQGNYADARAFFGRAVSKLRWSAEKQSALFGIVLNQMGLACVQLSDVQAAVSHFEEARDILEANCGPHHPDSLSVNSNLAAAYDALGRLDDAIAVLEYTLEAREEMHGMSDIEVEDEKVRLAELQKEAARHRARRYNGSTVEPTMLGKRGVTVN